MGRAGHIGKGLHYLRRGLPQVAHRVVHVADQGQPVLDHRGAPCLRVLLLNMSMVVTCARKRKL
jgi:hypothetical protein